TEVTFPEGLSSIGEGVFCDCDSLTEVTFPEGLSSIGDRAFYDCDSLTEVTFPEGLSTIGDYAFAYCAGLTEVTFPAGLTSIGSYAFCDCDGLHTITVQSDLTYSWNTFAGTNIRTLILTDAVTTVDADLLGRGTLAEIRVEDTDGSGLTAVDGVLYSYDSYLETYTLLGYPSAKAGTTYTVLDGTECIAGYAFYNCDLLEEVILPEALLELEEDAFYSCDTLATVEFGKYITTVDSDAFYNTPVTKVVLPAAMVSFPSAIRDLPELQEYDVPDAGNAGYRDIDGVLYHYDAGTDTLTLRGYPRSRTGTTYAVAEGTDVIGERAFYSCGSLAEVTFPEGLTTIGQNAFYSCGSLAEVTFPEGLTTIRGYAFYSCTSLTRVDLPKGLQSIGGDAFGYCSNLMTVNFPTTLTSIGSYAFYGCTYLKEIVLPASLRTINSYAFAGCTALKSAYFYGNAPSSFYSDAFYNTHPTFTIYFIEGKTGWTTPTWKGYSTAVFEPALTSGTCGDGLSWVLDEDGMLTITGAGAMTDCTADTAPWSAYATQVTQVRIGEDVTAIGANAFAGCTMLRQIWFEGEAPAIGENAFGGVNATARYPEDGTWTEDVRQNYGGTIVWVGMDTAPILTITAGEAYRGCTFTVDLTLGNTVPATALAITDILIDPACARVVDAEWLLSGSVIKDADVDAGSAVIAFDEAVDMNGVVLRLYLQAAEVDEDVECTISCAAVMEIDGVRTALTVDDETFTVHHYIVGDTNGDGFVNSADAIYLLRHTIMPERYPLNGTGFDYNHDGAVDADDAVYLLYAAMLPERYPLS
ncbi:MAG: leucine-rich repeat protein, partial [Clostridia bacterium]|nr:leucine-rich repeat protein [Clostridia bacterium]